MKILFFLLILLSSSIVFASAWVRKEGEFFISTSFSYQEATTYYDDNGTKKPIGCTFEQRELQVYGEYGIDQKDTAVFKLPYEWLNCGNNKTSGFGDLELGIIRNIKNGTNYSFSLYGNMIVPTGYSITDNPRISYGRFALEGGLLYGFSGNWGFWDSGIGYRHYFGYPSSQIRAYGGGGINITKNLQFLAFVDTQIGLGDGKRKQIGENAFLEPNYKLVQINLAPRIEFGNFSLVPGYQQTIYGRNVGDARGFFFNVWYDF
ncbi:MAG: hypothetical protein QXF15_03225 [Candidatus Aenigmatarchaeota archaeon]